jgi:hypothetical protein
MKLGCVPPRLQDDERTLEEEADLAARDGEAARKEEAEELQGLDEEAELPLEELMARWGGSW